MKTHEIAKMADYAILLLLILSFIPVLLPFLSTGEHVYRFLSSFFTLIKWPPRSFLAKTRLSKILSFFKKKNIFFYSYLIVLV